MKRKLLILIGALTSALVNIAKASTTHPTSINEKPTEPITVQITVQLLLTEEATELLNDLLEDGELALLPTGEFALRSISIWDLEKMGIISTGPTAELSDNSEEITVIDLQNLEALNEGGSKTVTSF